MKTTDYYWFVIALLFVVILLSGCVMAPVPVGYPYAYPNHYGYYHEHYRQGYGYRYVY